jgi:pectate lyase
MAIKRIIIRLSLGHFHINVTLLLLREEYFMKKGISKVVSALLAVSLATTGIITTQLVTSTSVVMAASPISIVASNGWNESCYIEWAGGSSDYAGYNAYVKASDASSWTQLDDELIRQYSDRWRADAVGLAAGSYDMKVVPYTSAGEVTADAITSEGLTVNSYDRSGFSFSSESTLKTGSGAYNEDGTLKSNAIVVYVTPDTAKTVQASITTGKTAEVLTGFQSIVAGLEKGLETRPVDIRIVGTITADDMDSFGSSSEGLQVKGKKSYSNLQLTIEGIGEDAAIKGFGILLRNTGNVELRNFAVLNAMDDCISIDTDNTNLWVHNLDLFYGQKGSAADQVKGDGTIDVKADSKYVTVSYNHLYDSGKSSLCGMKSESGPNYITYHHNWFDHSDSRHPRIRTMSVHVYNNYYDGNAKYGVGVTLGASAFVENNYFRNCKHPMLASMQGSDIMEDDKGVANFKGSGTFSKESGGIIKAYNNIVIGSDSDKFNGGVEPVYYDATATGTNGKATQFDAYLATTRSEKVPSSVVTVSGGSSYDNFDTSVDLGVDESSITPVENVPAVVTASAGRMNGGDIDWTFTSDDDTNYTVDAALQEAINNYTSSIVSFGGSTNGEVVTTGATTTTTTEVTTETTTAKVETTTETTTVKTTPVELSEPVTSEASGTNYVSYDSAKDTYTLYDTSADTTSLKLPIATEAITSGTVVISGTASLSVAAGKWAFLQVRGTNAEGKEGEIVALATDASKNITLRADGTNYASSSDSVAADKSYAYEFTIDLDNKTATLSVDGKTYTQAFTGTSITGIYAVTASTASRNVTISTPSVGIVDDTAVETTTEVTTTTTEVTTTTTTETATEDTTAAPVENPVYGDADASGAVEVQDAAALLQKVLKNTKTALETVRDDFMTYLDVDGDGKLTSADVAHVLQKALDSSYKFPVEK